MRDELMVEELGSAIRGANCAVWGLWIPFLLAVLLFFSGCGGGSQSPTAPGISLELEGVQGGVEEEEGVDEVQKRDDEAIPSATKPAVSSVAVDFYDVNSARINVTVVKDGESFFLPDYYLVVEEAASGKTSFAEKKEKRARKAYGALWSDGTAVVFVRHAFVPINGNYQIKMVTFDGLREVVKQAWRTLPINAGEEIGVKVEFGGPLTVQYKRRRSDAPVPPPPPSSPQKEEIFSFKGGTNLGRVDIFGFSTNVTQNGGVENGYLGVYITLSPEIRNLGAKGNLQLEFAAKNEEGLFFSFHRFEVESAGREVLFFRTPWVSDTLHWATFDWFTNGGRWTLYRLH